MVHFIKHEFLLQNKICNLTKYFFIFFVFCSGSITIVSSHDKIANLGIIFAVISIPLSLIGIAANFLRTELEDGTLEILLTSFKPIQIILIKFPKQIYLGNRNQIYN